MFLSELLEADKPSAARPFYRHVPDSRRVVEHTDYYWEVVGGQDKGGIVVRTTEEPNSEKKDHRLAHGALIRDLETVGNRMHYAKLAGEGPASGWISMYTREKLLLQKVEITFKEEEEEVKPPPEEEAPIEGQGGQYEVVAEKAMVRAAPSLQAKIISGFRREQVVEMFDWDETAKWRQVFIKNVGWGWMLLDKDDLPLLRPKGIPPQRKPLSPVAVAAMEDNTDHLQLFLEKRFDVNTSDEVGMTPLMLAAQADHPNCVLLLIKAGALASAKAKDGRTALDVAEKTAPVTQALLLALTLRDFDLSLCEVACSRIKPDLQALAKTKLQVPLRMQQEREEERRRQDQELQAQAPARSAADDGQDLYRVMSRMCAARAEPSTRSEIVGKKSAGDVVTVLDKDQSNRWALIEHTWTSRSGTKHDTAWISIESRDHGSMLAPVSPDEGGN